MWILNETIQIKYLEQCLAQNKWLITYYINDYLFISRSKHKWNIQDICHLEIFAILSVSLLCLFIWLVPHSSSFTFNFCLWEKFSDYPVKSRSSVTFYLGSQFILLIAFITMFNSYLFDYYFSLSFLSDWTSMKEKPISF